MKTCDQDAIQRQDDQWAQAPYQYKLQNMVRGLRTGNERRLIAVESERLMGYREHHTAVVLTLGLEPKDLERKRISLLGHAWHLSVAQFWLLTHFCDHMPRTENGAMPCINAHNIGE